MYTLYIHYTYMHSAYNIRYVLAYIAYVYVWYDIYDKCKTQLGVEVKISVVEQTALSYYVFI